MSVSRSSRRFRCWIVTGAASFFAIAPAHAESPADWPTRPVRLLVGNGAGGAADTVARNLANGFERHANGYALIVENRSGAGGTIAAAAVAREKPDGYTLFLAELGPNAVAHALTNVSYDPVTAFTPIIHAVNLPAVFLVRKSLPYSTLPEFIAAAKAQPGRFNYASGGVGNWTQLYMAYLSAKAGITQVNVSFRSGAEQLTAVLRDDCDTTLLSLSTSANQVSEGNVRALAGLSARRMPRLPDVPPVADTIPGFDLSVWHGVVGPAGMEPQLVGRINEVLNKVLNDDKVRDAIVNTQHGEVTGGTQEAFAAFLAAELKRWPAIVKQAGLTGK